jgi:hypothetical protein
MLFASESRLKLRVFSALAPVGRGLELGSWWQRSEAVAKPHTCSSLKSVCRNVDLFCVVFVMLPGRCRDTTQKHDGKRQLTLILARTIAP